MSVALILKDINASTEHPNYWLIEIQPATLLLKWFLCDRDFIIEFFWKLFEAVQYLKLFSKILAAEAFGNKHP